MHKTTESAQLFRSTITKQVIHCHVTPDIPGNYLFLSGIMTIEEMISANWEPIAESEYLGMPSPETLGKIYFEDLVKGIKYGCSVSEFIEDFLTSDDPIGDAICSVLYGWQEEGIEAPYNFVKAMRAYCEVQS